MPPSKNWRTKVKLFKFDLRDQNYSLPKIYPSKEDIFTWIKSKHSSLPTYLKSLSLVPTRIAYRIGCSNGYLMGWYGGVMNSTKSIGILTVILSNWEVGDPKIISFQPSFTYKWQWWYAVEMDSLWSTVMEKKYGISWGVGVRMLLVVHMVCVFRRTLGMDGLLLLDLIVLR